MAWQEIRANINKDKHEHHEVNKFTVCLTQRIAGSLIISHYQIETPDSRNVREQYDGEIDWRKSNINFISKIERISRKQ